MVFLVVLTMAGVSAADESARFPFPNKTAVKTVSDGSDKPASSKTSRYPMPSKASVVKTSNESELLLAEETETFSPSLETVEKTPALKSPPKTEAGKTSKGTASSEDMDLLKEHIKRLEDKLLKMEEEGDIRRRLESTEEEKEQKEDAILNAAGRDYTLMKPGLLGLEYSLRYSGDTYDSISDSDSVEHNAYHSITHSFTIEYPLKDNITLNTSVPFVYKYGSQTSSAAKDVSDLGDVSLGFQLQPMKSGSGQMSLILSGSLVCPTGRSPFDIDPVRELSTGSGYYSLGTGVNVSKTVDPLVVFGGLNYSKGIPVSHLNFKPTATAGEEGYYINKVTPGDMISYSMGIGYSLSYKASLTLSYQYSYQMKTRFLMVTQEDDGVVTDTTEYASEGSLSSVFSIGTGWNITPSRSVHVRLGIGLTNNDPDFSVMVRIPFTYTL